MKKSAGFTLIELVIVIVILGILGAVAAPRFINMQGDAYEANVKALNGSIQSAMTLANTKAILGGYDNVAGPAPTGDDLAGVSFAHGFPTADAAGIIAMLQDTESFVSEGEDGKASDKAYTYSTGTGTLTIYPSARYNNVTCKVEYTAAKNKNTPATVKAITGGC